MGRRKTSEEFIKQARIKHGDKYDYSKAKYVDARTNVVIICPTHGEFLQPPMRHYKHGCYKCGTNLIASKLRGRVLL